MEWPSTIADVDAVIVREDTPDGPRFVVHSRRAAQFTCHTYTEAEARTFAYAGQARAHVWYASGRGRLQLVGSFARAVVASTAAADAPDR